MEIGIKEQDFFFLSSNRKGEVLNVPNRKCLMGGSRKDSRVGKKKATDLEMQNKRFLKEMKEINGAKCHVCMSQ